MIEDLIQTYGYLAVVIGTFFEGETTLILAGVAAHLGYLNLPSVFGCALVGSLCADQLSFFLGRSRGKAFLKKRPSWLKQLERSERLLERYETPVILGFRFIYGLRIIIPFLIGVSSVSTKRFIVCNIISAVTWALLLCAGGYLFGSAIDFFIDDIKRYQHCLIGVIALVGAGIWIYFYMIKRGRSSIIKQVSDVAPSIDAPGKDIST